MRNLLIVTVALATLALSGDVWCSNCSSSSCMNDVQCGIRCACVKLDGYRGQCVQKW